MFSAFTLLFLVPGLSFFFGILWKSGNKEICVHAESQTVFSISFIWTAICRFLCFVRSNKRKKNSLWVTGIPRSGHFLASHQQFVGLCAGERENGFLSPFSLSIFYCQANSVPLPWFLAWHRKGKEKDKVVGGVLFLIYLCGRTTSSWHCMPPHNKYKRKSKWQRVVRFRSFILEMSSKGECNSMPEHQPAAAFGWVHLQ